MKRKLLLDQEKMCDTGIGKKEVEYFGKVHRFNPAVGYTVTNAAAADDVRLNLRLQGYCKEVCRVNITHANYFSRAMHY